MIENFDWNNYKHANNGKPILIMAGDSSVNQFKPEIYDKFYTIGVNHIYNYYEPDILIMLDKPSCFYGNIPNSEGKVKGRHIKTVQRSLKCVTASFMDNDFDIPLTISKDVFPGFKCDNNKLWIGKGSVTTAFHIACIVLGDQQKKLYCIGADGQNANSKKDHHWGNSCVKYDGFKLHWQMIQEQSVRLGIDLLNLSEISEYDFIKKCSINDVFQN